jgi:hypothetical protein
MFFLSLFFTEKITLRLTFALGFNENKKNKNPIKIPKQ